MQALGLVIQSYRGMKLITFEDKDRVIWTHVPSLFSKDQQDEITDNIDETYLTVFDDPNEMDNYGGFYHYVDDDMVKQFRDSPVPFEKAWFINEKGLEDYMTNGNPALALMYDNLMNTYPFIIILDSLMDFDSDEIVMLDEDVSDA